MKNKLLAACAALAVIASASPAMAAKYFDFTAVGANFTVTGTLTTSDQANKQGYDNNVGYRITDITGKVNNNTITNLLAPGSYPPGSVENDNLLLTSSPYLDLAGFAFETSGGPSPFNLYFDGGYMYIRGMNGNNTGVITSFTLTPQSAAVPEPASWAMMIAGFGLIGLATRRRTRTTVRFA